MLGIDVLIAVIFATSLHFIMGPGGMHSFGHAAYFGLGAYGAALLVKWLAAADGRRACSRAPLLALAGALLFGWFAVRLSGVYLAMLTLAFAQIVWAAVFQWEGFTGGSNGVVGVWPPPPFDSRCGLFPADTDAGGRRLCCCCAAFCSRRSATRCAPGAIRRCAPRPSASTSSACTGSASPSPARVCGVAGGLFAFAKGSISPETISVGRSIDGLVMVLLGGVQTLTGPIVGASVFAVLQDTVMRQTEYWRALLGAHHSAAGAGVPAGHRRRHCELAVRAKRGARMSVLSIRELSQVVRRRARRRRRRFASARANFWRMIGPNGAGKSTCFNMINGQLAPDSRRNSAATARTSPAWRRATSGGSASAAPFRSPRPSAR